MRSARFNRPNGFTLLEVMIAVAIMAIGLVVLLQIQARSILMAQQAHSMTVATQLARAKLYDCETDLLKKGFSVGDYNEEGKFDEEGFDDFFWECHAYQPDLPTPDATQIAEGSMNMGEMMGGPPGGENPMAAVGMGMIAPMLGQVSSVLGDTIRELVVIVRWREGEYWNDLRVATHIIDVKIINQMAGQMQALSQGGMPGLPPGLAESLGGGSPDSTMNGDSPVAPPPGEK
jgi:general secretion pathway protein I